jgi:excisionase family DNA binding protein
MSVFKASFPTFDNSQILQKHISVQTIANVTGNNIQYLRRLLRSGTLEEVKIGQIWLIELESLEAYLLHVESTSDRRCGPKKFFDSPRLRM